MLLPVGGKLDDRPGAVANDLEHVKAACRGIAAPSVASEIEARLPGRLEPSPRRPFISARLEKCIVRRCEIEVPPMTEAWSIEPQICAIRRKEREGAHCCVEGDILSLADVVTGLAVVEKYVLPRKRCP